MLKLMITFGFARAEKLLTIGIRIFKKGKRWNYHSI
jgi:hypothetical protein